MKYLSYLLYAIIIGIVFFWINFITTSFIIFPDITNQKKLIEVPNLIGLSFNKAKRLVNKKSIKISIVDSLYSNNFKMNSVINQNIPPNFYARQNITLEVTISKGKNLSVVPDLREKQLNNAMHILAQREIIPGKLIFTYSNTYPKNRIITSSPLPNTIVSKGSTIDLLISKGYYKTDIFLPDFTGKNIFDIIPLFQKNNITYILYSITSDSTYKKINTHFENKIVVLQKPAPNSAFNPNFDKLKLFLEE